MCSGRQHELRPFLQCTPGRQVYFRASYDHSPYFMKMTCPALHMDRQGNTVKPRGNPRKSLHFGDVSPSPFLTCTATVH
jgi:hypothetical protein